MLLEKEMKERSHPVHSHPVPPPQYDWAIAAVAATALSAF